MTTMATQTSRARKMLNLLKRLAKQDYLYTEEKLREIKSQIRVLEHELSEMEKKTFKGFGNLKFLIIYVIKLLIAQVK